MHVLDRRRSVPRPPCTDVADSDFPEAAPASLADSWAADRAHEPLGGPSSVEAQSLGPALPEITAGTLWASIILAGRVRRLGVAVDGLLRAQRAVGQPAHAMSLELLVADLGAQAAEEGQLWQGCRESWSTAVGEDTSSWRFEDQDWLLSRLLAPHPEGTSPAIFLL